MVALRPAPSVEVREAPGEPSRALRGEGAAAGPRSWGGVAGAVPHGVSWPGGESGEVPRDLLSEAAWQGVETEETEQVRPWSSMRSKPRMQRLVQDTVRKYQLL